MGTFLGHVLPGSFFLLFGLWWTVSLCRRYFRCLTHGSKTRHFRSSLSFLCPCSRTIPVESILKLSASLCGIFGETVTAFKGGRFVNMVNAQHICMYIFFALNGFVEILSFYRAPLPEDSDYVTGALALVVEALLFRFHLHGRSMLDSHIHILLVHVIIASAIAILLEMRYRNNVHIALTRTFCTLLQGTWFIQIAFILYNPVPGAKPWSEGDHQEMMLVTSLFVGHIVGNITLIAFVGLITWWRMKSSIGKHTEAYTLLDDIIGEQTQVSSEKERMTVGMEIMEDEF